MEIYFTLSECNLARYGIECTNEELLRDGNLLEYLHITIDFISITQLHGNMSKQS